MELLSSIMFISSLFRFPIAKIFVVFKTKAADFKEVEYMLQCNVFLLP